MTAPVADRADEHGLTSRQTPVAIVGMAVLLPGAPDLAAYWENLRTGVDAITEVPAGRWDADYYDPAAAGGGPAVPDRLYCRRGGFVDGLAQVQPTRFGLMPNSVPGTEPDQLIALQVAAAALADAGGVERLPDRDRVGVVLGRGGYLTPGLVRLDQRVRGAQQLVRTLGELVPDLTSHQLATVKAAFAEQLGEDRPESAIGLVPNLAASRLANRLDLRGPAYTVDAACASSLVAVDQAVGELATGRCDVVLAGGVHHCHDVTLWSVFAQLRALSPSQRIRPFHRGADGLLVGEGTGVVVLKRLADAQRDGDRVYAVIRGTGVASDGRTAGLANPDPGGQSRAVRAAWRTAGLDPAAPGALGLLEAHGTATPAGDAAELATLAAVFGPSTGEAAAPVLGSVKSMIGHTMPAAGVAGLVKAALAVHHGVLLPTLHCEEPHPALAATRFRTIDAARPWETAPGGAPRRAGVNAFGFGGINAHVLLEEAPDSRAPARRPGATATATATRTATATATATATSTATATATVTVTEPERVLRLAADSPEQLAELLAADDRDLLSAAAADSIGALATAAPATAAPPCRVAIADPTAKRLALARRAVARGRAWRGRSDVWFAPRPLLGADRADPAAGRIAFLFPGLESEFAPRVDDVADHLGLPRPSASAGPGTAQDPQAARVGDIGRHGVGVVAVGRLLETALRRMGVHPDAMAGHSVGEWTAMIASGVYAGASVDAFLESFDPDALRVRGWPSPRSAPPPTACSTRWPRSRGCPKSSSPTTTRRSSRSSAVRAGRSRSWCSGSAPRVCSASCCRSSPASTPRCWPPTWGRSGRRPSASSCTGRPCRSGPGRPPRRSRRTRRRCARCSSGTCWSRCGSGRWWRPCTRRGSGRSSRSAPGNWPRWWATRWGTGSIWRSRRTPRSATGWRSCAGWPPRSGWTAPTWTRPPCAPPPSPSPGRNVRTPPSRWTSAARSSRWTRPRSPRSARTWPRPWRHPCRSRPRPPARPPARRPRRSHPASPRSPTGSRSPPNWTLCCATPSGRRPN